MNRKERRQQKRNIIKALPRFNKKMTRLQQQHKALDEQLLANPEDESVQAQLKMKLEEIIECKMQMESMIDYAFKKETITVAHKDIQPT